MNQIIFIQSVSGKEWEIGEIMHNAIHNNPEYENCTSYLRYAKSFDELATLVDAAINEFDTKDYVIIQLVSHSNKDVIAFRNVASNNAEVWNDEKLWICMQDLIEKLYYKFGNHALFISISCESESYFKRITYPHINLIGGEDGVSSHRAEELLFSFYKALNESNDFEISYNTMISKFPIEEELKREERERAVMRFFRAT